MLVQIARRLDVARPERAGVEDQPHSRGLDDPPEGPTGRVTAPVLVGRDHRLARASAPRQLGLGEAGSPAHRPDKLMGFHRGSVYRIVYVRADARRRPRELPTRCFWLADRLQAVVKPVYPSAAEDRHAIRYI